MKASSIERVDFAELNLDSARVELAQKAASLLGYSKLQPAAGGKLLLALKQLDITPLINSQVRSYKNNKEKTTQWSGRITGQRLALLAALLCGTAAFLIRSDITQKWIGWYDGIAGAGTVVSIILAIFTAISAIHFVFTTGQDRGYRKIWKWTEIDISRYDGTIPEYALVKATAIKELVPDATFKIDQLVIESERAEMNARERDPFLVVYLDDESFYIDVWDEKEYEKVL